MPGSMPGVRKVRENIYVSPCRGMAVSTRPFGNRKEKDMSVVYMQDINGRSLPPTMRCGHVINVCGKACHWEENQIGIRQIMIRVGDQIIRIEYG